MMHFAGVLQPFLKGRGSSSRTHLTDDEKRAFADGVSSGALSNVPTCVDHAGGCEANFEVPEEKRLGRLTDAYVDEAGNLAVVSSISDSRPEAAAIMTSIAKRRVPWGLSAWTEFAFNQETGEISNRRITHAGITTDPVYGPEGSWIQLYSDQDWALRNALRDEFARRPPKYLPPAFATRLEQTRTDDLFKRQLVASGAAERVVPTALEGVAAAAASLAGTSRSPLLSAAQSSSPSSATRAVMSNLATSASNQSGASTNAPDSAFASASSTTPDSASASGLSAAQTMAAPQSQTTPLAGTSQQQQQQSAPNGGAAFVAAANMALKEANPYRRLVSARSALDDLKSLYARRDVDLDELLTADVVTKKQELASTIRQLESMVEEVSAQFVKAGWMTADSERVIASVLRAPADEVAAGPIAQFAYAAADQNLTSQRNLEKLISVRDQHVQEVVALKNRLLDKEREADDYKQRYIEMKTAKDAIPSAILDGKVAATEASEVVVAATAASNTSASMAELSRAAIAKESSSNTSKQDSVKSLLAFLRSESLSPTQATKLRPFEVDSKGGYRVTTVSYMSGKH